MQLKEKVINCVSNGKDMTSHLIVGLIKKTLNEIPCIKMSEYFPKVFKINVKVDLSYYATKTDIKNISHIDTSSFTLKSNLASL